MAIPTMWRTQKQRYSLQGEICPECCNAVFPPRKVCPHCNQERRALGGEHVVDSVGDTGVAASKFNGKYNGTYHSIVFAMPHILEVSATGDD